MTPRPPAIIFAQQINVPTVDERAELTEILRDAATLAGRRGGWPAERPNHSAPRIAASEEGVPAIFGGVLSLNLINSFAANRTKSNMNPPPAIPYITEADTQSQRSMA
jgi:hypothetical protein